MLVCRYKEVQDTIYTSQGLQLAGGGGGETTNKWFYYAMVNAMGYRKTEAGPFM